VTAKQDLPNTASRFDPWRDIAHERARITTAAASRCDPAAKNGELEQSRRGCSGSSRAYAIVLAMRYVIVIVAITFFLIWDGLYHHGYYLDMTVRELSRIVRYATGAA
jgi:hypothetical protein